MDDPVMRNYWKEKRVHPTDTTTMKEMTGSSNMFQTPIFPCYDNSSSQDNNNDDAIPPFPYSDHEDVLLPKDFHPSKHDVITGRGKKSYNHIGNRRFRQLTAMNLKRYMAAKCKVDKTMVVLGIVQSIRKSARPCGGFIKRCPKSGRWISMSDEAAREKVGHCLRDMIGSLREERRQGNKTPRVIKVGGQGRLAKLSHSSAAATSKGEALNALSAIASTLSTHHIPSAGVGGGNNSSQSARMVHEGSNSGRRGSSSNKKDNKPNSRSKAYSPAAIAAATAATIPIPPTAQKQKQQQNQNYNPYHQFGNFSHNNKYRNAASLADFNAAAAAVASAASAAHHHPHHRGFPPAMAEMQHIASTFNNFNYNQVTKGSAGQDMSIQQRKILALLEGGFKGTVEELIQTAR